MDWERDAVSACIPHLSQCYSALALVLASHPGAARRDQRGAFLLTITLPAISLTPREYHLCFPELLHALGIGRDGPVSTASSYGSGDFR